MGKFLSLPWQPIRELPVDFGEFGVELKLIINIFLILCKEQIGVATFSGYFNRKRTRRKQVCMKS